MAALDLAPPEPERPRWFERGWVRTLWGRRGRPLGLVLLAVLLFALLALERGPIHSLRLACFDTYQVLAPRKPKSAPVVIVEINDASLKEHGQWPWPRTLLAQLVRTIAEAGPAAIGIDILMPEPDRLSPASLAALVPHLDTNIKKHLESLPTNDTVLADVLQGLPVALGVVGLERKETKPAAGEKEAARASPGRLAPVRIFGEDPTSFVRSFDALLRNVEPIDDAADGHGLLSVDLDGGRVRRVALMANVRGTFAPAMAVELLRIAVRAPAFSLRVGREGIKTLGIGRLSVRTETDGSVWIHYARNGTTRFIPASRVLAGEVDRPLFEGKLVLIGVTALGLADFWATPVADHVPDVEIHAQLVESIVDGDLLTRPRWARVSEAGVLAAGGLLLIAMIPRWRVRISGAVLLVLVVAVALLGFLGYLRFRILLDAAWPALGLGVLFATMLGVTLAEADSQRRALRRQVERQREAALRLAGELEAARRIQMGILPNPTTAFPSERRFSLRVWLEPAREVGGDLYDFFRLDDDRALILIGDVSGKGLPGSLFMALAKSLCKSIALRRRGDISLVMREASEEISRDNGESLFVTVWAAILDARTGDVEYCNAGHDPPYLLPGVDGALSRLVDGVGPPLCVVEDYAYAAAAYRMRPGESLVLFTDGVTEATSVSGEFYGRERLEDVLARLGAGPDAEEVGEAIRRDVSRFATGVEPSDDLAILVLRWNGDVSAR